MFTSFSELLEEMFPRAVELGIPSTQYWSMTFEELMVQVQANVNIKNHEARDTANHNYILANLMAYSLNDPSSMPSAEKVYPVLKEKLPQERVTSSTSTKEETTPQWQIDQRNMLEHMKRIKNTRKRKGVK